jgi:hypothetical protein
VPYSTKPLSLEILVFQYNLPVTRHPILRCFLTPKFYVYCTLLLGNLTSKSTLSPEDFMTQVSSIYKEESKLVNPPLFIFKRCRLAAAHNAEILKRSNINLNRIICHQHPSQISYGSKFRSLSDHPLWTHLKDILDNRAIFPLEPISDDNRAIDFAYHRDWGNHKSLSQFATFIDPIISENIEHGFALPLPIDLLDKLPNSSLASLGCHKQTMINDLGKK